MHQNMSLGSNGMGCVHFEKFRCDFVPRTFVPVRPVLHRVSKVNQTSQMHQNCTNAPKHEFRVQWGGLGALVKKNSDATLRHELLLAHIALSFVSQPNGPKCTKIVRTHQNMSLGSNGVDCGCEKFRRDFVSRTFAPVRPILHRVS